jgi:hypothetical protein
MDDAQQDFHAVVLELKRTNVSNNTSRRKPPRCAPGEAKHDISDFRRCFLYYTEHLTVGEVEIAGFGHFFGMTLRVSEIMNRHTHSRLARVR